MLYQTVGSGECHAATSGMCLDHCQGEEQEEQERRRSGSVSGSGSGSVRGPGVLLCVAAALLATLDAAKMLKVLYC